jgi:hypothetical protein
MQALDVAAFGARAHATCSFCSHQKFRIVIFDKGGWEPRCSKCRHPQAPEQPEASQPAATQPWKAAGDARRTGTAAKPRRRRRRGEWSEGHDELALRAALLSPPPSLPP